MPIVVRCISCGVVGQVPDSAAGKTTQCSCGAIMVVPAATAVITQPQTPSASASAPAQPKAAAKVPLVVWLLGVPIGLVILCCGGCISVGMVLSSVNKGKIQEAHRLYAEGKQDQAVALYKEYFDYAGANKGEVCKRIVDFEAGKGNKADAKTWIERAHREKLNVNYQSEGAKTILAGIEREEKEAKHKAEREAAEREAEAKKKRDAKQDTKPAKQPAGGELVLVEGSVESNRNNFGTTRIKGTVVNQRKRRYQFVEITFNLYDASGARVGTARANINGLEPGERWNFEAIGIAEDSVSYKLAELSGF